MNALQSLGNNVMYISSRAGEQQTALLDERAANTLLPGGLSLRTNDALLPEQMTSPTMIVMPKVQRCKRSTADRSVCVRTVF